MHARACSQPKFARINIESFVVYILAIPHQCIPEIIYSSFKVVLLYSWIYKQILYVGNGYFWLIVSENVLGWNVFGLLVKNNREGNSTNVLNIDERPILVLGKQNNNI